MTTLTGFVDVEALLLAFFGLTIPSARSLTITPSDLEGQLPVIQINRIGGGDTVPSLDRCLVDVEAYDKLRPDAKSLAAQIRSALRYKAPGFSALGASITDVVTSSAPAERPYKNTNLFRIGATYEIGLHNHQ